MDFNNVQLGYMNYIPLPYLAKHAGVSMEDIATVIGDDTIRARAKKSLDTLDLTHFIDEVDSIKLVVTKVMIIRNELFRRGSNDFKILTQAEACDNLIKKLSNTNLKEWISEDVEVIEETGYLVDTKWVFMAETADTKLLLPHARTLVDKFILKPEGLRTFEDYEAHAERCIELGFDPMTEDEDMVKEIYNEVNQ